MRIGPKTLTDADDEVNLNQAQLDLASSVSFQYGVGGVGTVVLEGSNDGTNWHTQEITPIGGGAGVTSAAVAGIWWATVVTTQLRVRKTVAGGGGVDIMIDLHAP